MAKNKTTENEGKVSDYIAAIGDEKKRQDCASIIDLFTQQTGLEPKMWGAGIVGFGSYDYKYESGREGTAPIVALAARANAITLYLGSSFEDREELLSKFGKHKTGKGCIYIQKIEDIDLNVLSIMVKNSFKNQKG